MHRKPSEFLFHRDLKEVQVGVGDQVMCMEIYSRRDETKAAEDSSQQPNVLSRASF